MNDSKAPFSVFQDINTSPSVSEHSYLKKSQYSNKPTFENNLEKGRRSPWKNNFIKVEKYALKNANKSRSVNPSKPISNIATPKKEREKSVQPLQAIKAVNTDKFLNSNSSWVSKGPQPMNYNKIYQKLKARSGSTNNVVSNSVSYGSFKVAKYENIPSTERKKRNIIDSVFNNLMNNTNSVSPYRKEGYSKNATMFVNKPFEIPGNFRYVKKPITARSKSVNILNY